jgi:hypothetical protein
MSMRYTVERTATTPELQGKWDGPVWGPVEALRVALFQPKSSDHRPDTQAKLLYDAGHIYGLFRVQDRYVRCVHMGVQDSVCLDSCVEFFTQPDRGTGYFNFEMNGSGNLLCYYISDCSRTPQGFKAYTPLKVEDLQQVRIAHSLPARVEPEIVTPTTWTVEFAIPLAMLERYTGPIGDLRGRAWRANFYKCADQTSHPHWASWAPISELNFHLPQCFGTIAFA